ncbi:hypothetical protein D3C72_1075450 [compost metagenome]
MLSHGEVTQAVRLRLYNKPNQDRQHLYIFSNVQLINMYADEFTTLKELAQELGASKQDKGNASRAAIELWFEDLPIGREFRTRDIKAEGDRRYFQEWLRVAGVNGWVEKRGQGRGSSYVKLSEPT